jgi:arylformamidase
MSPRSGRIYDISVPVDQATPRWPGSPAFRAERWMDLDRGDIATDTAITGSAHLGTHIDAPSHFLKGGATVDQVPLELGIGPCWVAEFTAGGAIGPKELAAAWPAEGTERLLLRTPNSRLWATAGSTFQQDFVGLSAEGAQWLVERGVRLIGIDYLSIQRFNDPPDTHLHLLRAGVLILEGLDLSEVPAGGYELWCLPVRYRGIEAAPARAILREMAK